MYLPQGTADPPSVCGLLQGESGTESEQRVALSVRRVLQMHPVVSLIIERRMVRALHPDNLAQVIACTALCHQPRLAFGFYFRVSAGFGFLISVVISVVLRL